jgi:hypothetical protein
MKRKFLSLVFGTLFWLSPSVAEDFWLDTLGYSISFFAGAYAVNYVHESGHWVVAELLNHDADIEVHPFSGHAKITDDQGPISRRDKGLIAIGGPAFTRGAYEWLNAYLYQREWDMATPFLSWTALGLRLDLPWQQAKAGWAHLTAKERRRDDDMTKFYDSLSKGTNERRILHLLGGFISLLDLWTDADEIMRHLSGGIGEKPMKPREARHWFLNSDGSNLSLDWSYGF